MRSELRQVHLWPGILSSEQLHQQSSVRETETCLGIFGRKVFSTGKRVLTKSVDKPEEWTLWGCPWAFGFRVTSPLLGF